MRFGYLSTKCGEKSNRSKWVAEHKTEREECDSMIELEKGLKENLKLIQDIRQTEIGQIDNNFLCTLVLLFVFVIMIHS